MAKKKKKEEPGIVPAAMSEGINVEYDASKGYELYESTDHVTQRDGITVLKMGDEVEVINYNTHCEGKTFIICEMRKWSACESGVMIVVHLKGEPERKILGLVKEGMDLGPPGLDANWFKLVNNV